MRQIAAFMDDPRIQRTGPDAVVPKCAQLEQQTRAFLSKSVMSCILEAKKPLSSEDDDTWVGNIHLFSVPGFEQHRDTFFGIALGESFPIDSNRLRIDLTCMVTIRATMVGTWIWHCETMSV
jgi:hypothetical protein